MKICLILLVLLCAVFSHAGELEIYIDQSSSANRDQMRQILAHALKELPNIPKTKIRVRVIGFFSDGWNAEAVGEVSFPQAPPQNVDCGKPQFSDLAKISRAQRARETAEFQQACIRRGEEQLRAHRKMLAEAVRQLQEFVETTLSRRPPGRCTDVSGLLGRLARSHGPSSHGAQVVALVVSDMVSSCTDFAPPPEDVVRGRIFIAPVQPAKSQSTARKYFFDLEQRLHRIAPWARVIPGSFDLSEVLDALVSNRTGPAASRQNVGQTKP